MDDSSMQTADVPTQIMAISTAAAKQSTTGIDMVASAVATTPSNKTLKRCLSVPILRVMPGSSSVTSIPTMTTRSAAAAAAIAGRGAANCSNGSNLKEDTSKKPQNINSFSNSHENTTDTNGTFGHNIYIGIPRSNPSSREVSPAPMFNIFAPRARRYSASYTPLNVTGIASGNAGGGSTPASSVPLCLTPRVSQLRQEECVDIMNSREVNHEREVHSAMQMSQSWEDLTLVAENWSCKSDEFSNPLQVALPSSVTSCSSPSPTSNRAGLRLPYGLSPSPTRRTFATRRSMSPIAMRPSQLGPVKRKFELDDNSAGSNWNVYSPPPLKKIFTESRGSSPVCQSPSSVCPSPDSGTYDGRITPKLFISKLCTNNTNNSSNCSSPSSSVSGGPIDSTTTSGICSSASSTTSSVSGGSEPMCVSSSVDEGISISENEDKLGAVNRTSRTNSVQPMSTDIQDEATLMDDMKSETSSIGGCSSISIESSSCDSATKAAASFLNRLNVDDINTIANPLVQKNFFINKQGLSGPKKYIVNHDNLLNNEQINNNANSISENGIPISHATGVNETISIVEPTERRSGHVCKRVAAKVLVEQEM